MLWEMQSVLSRIWTRVAVSISYDDNYYTSGTSLKRYKVPFLKYLVWSDLGLSHGLWDHWQTLYPLYYIYIIYIYISLNIIDIFCLYIFLLILSYCRIDFYSIRRELIDIFFLESIFKPVLMYLNVFSYWHYSKNYFKRKTRHTATAQMRFFLQSSSVHTKVTPVL